jgi:hypothetical protein
MKNITIRRKETSFRWIAKRCVKIEGIMIKIDKILLEKAKLGLSNIFQGKNKNKMTQSPIK